MKGKNKLWLFLIPMLIFAIFDVTAAPPNLTTIYITPTTNVANPGEYFTIYINVAGINVSKPLNFWEVKLRFKPEILYTDKTMIHEGSFLHEAAMAEGYDTLFFKYVGPNYTQIGCLINGPVGASGSGNLATVTFLVKVSKKCNLNLYGTILYDPNFPQAGSEIRHKTTDATFDPGGH